MSATVRPITAADVAQRAGVSRATVSHILGGRAASFAEDTRRRVEDAAAELDYRPSAAGRSLVRGRSDTLVILAPPTTIGKNQQTAMDRLSERTAGMGMNVVLRFADVDPQQTVTALLRLNPFAVVDLGALPGRERERLARQGVPTVPRDDRMRRDRRPLDETLALLQVEELQRRSRRPIVVAALGDGHHDPTMSRRYEVIRQFCADRSLPAPQLVEIPPDGAAAGQIFGPLFANGPVGVAAYNDLVALAASTVAQQLGLRVPDDVAIVGVDDTPYGQFVSPALSSIAVNMNLLMDEALRQLGEEWADVDVLDDRTPHDRDILTLRRRQTS